MVILDGTEKTKQRVIIVVVVSHDELDWNIDGYRVLTDRKAEVMTNILVRACLALLYMSMTELFGLDATTKTLFMV